MHPAGRDGENLAVRFLKKRGYRIIRRNFTCRAGEIDIIARDGDTLVFVEVKSRRSSDVASPELSVTPVKQRRISMAAVEFRRRRRLFDINCRFDIISIVMPEGEEPEIKIFPDAFPLRLPGRGRAF